MVVCSIEGLSMRFWLERVHFGTSVHFKNIDLLVMDTFLHKKYSTPEGYVTYEKSQLKISSYCLG